MRAAEHAYNAQMFPQKQATLSLLRQRLFSLLCALCIGSSRKSSELLMSSPTMSANSQEEEVHDDNDESSNEQPVSSPPNSPSSRLFVCVPRSEDHLRSDGSRSSSSSSSSSLYPWSLHKRYSQFQALRDTLRSRYPVVDAFHFPNKSKFNTFSEWTKERRRNGFEDFMTVLVGIWPRPAELDEFLELHERTGRHRSGSSGSSSDGGSAQ
eukprot:5752-Heterococcus_DN1.PRE.2